MNAQPEVDSVQAFFPSAGGAWVNIFDFSRITTFDRNITVPAPLGAINVHLRPSRIILTHAEPRYTTYESAQGPFGLLVNLDDHGEASGEAYVDDGISRIPTPNKELRFVVQNNLLLGSAEGEYNIEQKLDRITLLGVKREPKDVYAGDRKLEVEFDEGKQVLTIKGVDVDLNKWWKVQWT